MSLSLAAQGVFKSEQFRQASRTMPDGRLVRYMTPSSQKAGPQTPRQKDQQGAVSQDSFNQIKAKDSRPLDEPRLLGKLGKLVLPPDEKTKTSLVTEPDAEPSPVPDENSERSDRDDQLKRHEAELLSLTAKLMDAKEQAERLKTNEEKRAADVAAEREGRRLAEVEALKLQSKCKLHEQLIHKMQKDRAKETARLAAEKAELERRLKRLHKKPGHGSGKSPADSNCLATHMADAECAPLRHCTTEEKAALKKKLLLKWHPDKQPSVDHASFATCVVQEMQNRAEWRD